MIQEEKDLLVRDLYARLPYGTMIQAKEWATVDTELKFGHIDRLIYDELKLKPYLRSLSSMTEEEKKELLQISNFNSDVDDICYDSICCIERTSINITDIANFISWLNAHHFDYQGLIEKGLALEAPKDMYMHLKT